MILERLLIQPIEARSVVWMKEEQTRRTKVRAGFQAKRATKGKTPLKEGLWPFLPA